MKKEQEAKDKNDNEANIADNEVSTNSEGAENIGDDMPSEEHDKSNNQEEELSELEKKDEEISALNDKYLRLYSEFDNFRRRTQKEKLELYKTAGEDIFSSLLPVMDDFERAIKSMEENKNLESLKEGVDLIYNKLNSVFKTNGLETMESSIGKKFDSEMHEAVTQIPAPSKKMKGKVVDEIEKGYILKDKVIRYAKVVVGQ